MNSIESFSCIFLCVSQLKNFLFSISTTIFWILSLFGYQRFYITSKDTRRLIAKNIQTKYKLLCNKFNENKEPYGVCFHKSLRPNFMYNFEIYEESYIFCKRPFFDEISTVNYEKVDLKLNKNFIPESDNNNNNSDSESDEEEERKTKKIKYVVKKGDYGYFDYSCRGISIMSPNRNDRGLTFFAYQETLFKQIMNFYKDNNYCKVFLSGDPGCGKTFFSYMMAQKLGCYLCDSFDPYEPSSNFNEIYSTVKLSPICPMILLIDEVDILINKIHNQKTSEHSKYSREIFDKTSYTSFMDKIEFGLYPNVILIMNSNKKKREIDNIDKAYLRAGRINIIDQW
jgi:hypothetical protein